MHGGFDEGNTLQVATNKLVASADTGLDQGVFGRQQERRNSLVIPRNYCTIRCPIYIHETVFHSA
jgi:hypothetical protein